MTYRYTVLAVFIVSLSLANPLVAQSVSVFGADNDARACYQAARTAALIDGADDAALARCTRALDHGRLKLRDRAATYVNRGVLRAKLEKYVEALSDYNHAANLRPQLAEIYVNRGNVHYLTRAFDKAIEEYTQALALDTGAAPVAYVNRGMSHEKLGMGADALADYRKAVELAPEWRIAQRKLAALLTRQRPPHVN